MVDNMADNMADDMADDMADNMVDNMADDMVDNMVDSLIVQHKYYFDNYCIIFHKSCCCTFYLNKQIFYHKIPLTIFIFFVYLLNN